LNSFDGVIFRRLLGILKILGLVLLISWKLLGFCVFDFSKLVEFLSFTPGNSCKTIFDACMSPDQLQVELLTLYHTSFFHFFRLNAMKHDVLNPEQYAVTG
jgi:hypothetical protein